jgi:hypothetical protein
MQGLLHLPSQPPQRTQWTQGQLPFPSLDSPIPVRKEVHVDLCPGCRRSHWNRYSPVFLSSILRAIAQLVGFLPLVGAYMFIYATFAQPINGNHPIYI